MSADAAAREENGSRKADATPDPRCSVCGHTFEDCTCGGEG